MSAFEDGSYNQWIFTEDELLQTPSVLDGMPPELEREQRGKGINFITQVGIQLKLPQLTLATASIYLHRFYMRNSLKRNHYYEIAATSLFLATKVEENLRKFGDFVAACVRTAQKNPTLQVHRDDKEFWRWKDCILGKEEMLLEAICFDLSVGDVSYNLLMDLLRQLNVNDRQLFRTAWAFLNDANHTMLCLLYPARTIAAAALYCSAKHVNARFPDQDGKPWWEAVGVKIKHIKRACNYIAQVYENNPLRGDDRPKYVTTPEDSREPTKTRARPYENGSPAEKRTYRQSTEEGEVTDPGPKRVKLDDVSPRPPSRHDRNGQPPPSGPPGPPPPLPLLSSSRHERNGQPGPPPPRPEHSSLPPPSASLPPKPEVKLEDSTDGDLEEGEVDD